ncbi:hypothetical protein [Dactylosporangium darangshiense]
MISGSNGGGDLYAIATDDGPVFRLRDAEYLHGVCHGTERGITVVREGLHTFLDHLPAAVTAPMHSVDLSAARLRRRISAESTCAG